MIYMRGNPKDYDLWAALGNKGWSFQDVLPYFNKLENMQIPELAASKSIVDCQTYTILNVELILTEKYHGIYGPINVEYGRHYTWLRDAFLEAGKYLGYEVNFT